MPRRDARPDGDHELPVHVYGEAVGRGRGVADELGVGCGYAAFGFGRDRDGCRDVECDAAPVDRLTKTTTDDLVAGDPIVYTITATNNGDVTLTDVQICEGLTDATVVGTCPAATLAPAATTRCQFTYTAKQSDVDAGSLTNSA